MENFTLINYVFALGGFGIATMLWYVMWTIGKFSIRRRMRRDLYANLPFSAEEIEQNRNLERAQNLVQIRQLELRIAECKRDVAMAEAKTADSLGRINELNTRIEILMLENRSQRMLEEYQEDAGDDVKQHNA